MIDVYAAADLLLPGSDRQLGEELCMAILHAEGVAAPGPFHLNNTAAYIHRLDSAVVPTAASASARKVRVQVVTPPGALTRVGHKQLVQEVTEIIAKISGDPTQASRTWVLLTEGVEGGLGTFWHGIRARGVFRARGQSTKWERDGRCALYALDGPEARVSVFATLSSDLDSPNIEFVGSFAPVSSTVLILRIHERAATQMLVSACRRRARA